MAKWVIDPAHSLVEFSVKHMMITTVKGRFSKFEGTIEADPANLAASKYSLTVDTASIDTRDEQRDNHLRSADFFNVAEFPKLAFVSKSVKAEGGNEFTLTGDLTMHGVTKEVSFPLTFEGTGKNPWGKEVISFAAETKVNRKDFALEWNVALEAGGVLVSEQVKISIELQAVREG